MSLSNPTLTFGPSAGKKWEVLAYLVIFAEYRHRSRNRVSVDHNGESLRREVGNGG
jgi:hypothetical protein